VPLVSNLNIFENIAIVMQANLNTSSSKVESYVFSLLDKFDLRHLSLSYKDELSSGERFIIKIIRASVYSDLPIVIIDPFEMISHKYSVEWFCEIFDTLDIDKNIVIIDVLHNKKLYEGLECKIKE
jgi:ABC-type lipoprotein export system ATPase subunit